jgi:hypothetical protein
MQFATIVIITRRYAAHIDHSSLVGEQKFLSCARKIARIMCSGISQLVTDDDNDSDGGCCAQAI